MQKIFIWATLIITSLFLTNTSFSAGGAPDESNVNSSSFMVDLAKMDPLNSKETKTTGGIASLETVLGNTTNLLLILIPILAAVSVLISGYLYIFSAGDSEKAGRAKTIIKWNIVAIFVAFLSVGIVQLVAYFFNT